MFLFILSCCCDKLPQVSNFKQHKFTLFFFVLEVRSLKSTGLHSFQRPCFPSSRGCPHLLADSPFLHLQASVTSSRFSSLTSCLSFRRNFVIIMASPSNPRKPSHLKICTYALEVLFTMEGDIFEEPLFILPWCSKEIPPTGSKERGSTNPRSAPHR